MENGLQTGMGICMDTKALPKKVVPFNFGRFLKVIATFLMTSGRGAFLKEWPSKAVLFFLPYVGE